MSTKDEIFEYVMKSPENTNPAVLRSMLDGIEGGSGKALTIFSLTKPEEVLLLNEDSTKLLTDSLTLTLSIEETSYILPGVTNNYKFCIGFNFSSLSDDYIVTLNGQKVPFLAGKPSGTYNIIYESEIYPTEINVVITRK